MDSPGEWCDNNVYLTLPTSLTASLVTGPEAGFDTAENKPIIHILEIEMRIEVDLNSSENELCFSMRTAILVTTLPFDWVKGNIVFTVNTLVGRRRAEKKEILQSIIWQCSTSRWTAAGPGLFWQSVACKPTEMIELASHGNCFFESCECCWPLLQ